MKMCEHEFKPLKIERDGKKVRACQECGALKIGEDTVVVDQDYIELSPLTADPTLKEGRIWFRGDENEQRWSPDGANVEIFSTVSRAIKGLVYLAEGTPTDSWKFTADPSKDVWIRQYSTDACFQSKYNYHGSYAHWVADNTFVEVPNKADNVYGDGEVLSVSQVPDGTIVDRWFCWGGGTGPQDMAWDGQYFWSSKGETCDFLYRFNYGEEMVAGKGIHTPSVGVTCCTWDGQYLWMRGTAGAGGIHYQLKKDGTVVSSFTGGPEHSQGLAWDGEYLWISTLQAHHIYKYTPGGVQKDFFEIPYDHEEGAGFDGQYLYICNDTGGAGANVGNHVYRYKRDGTLMDSFWHPGATGEACLWDGKYMYVNSEDCGYVYVIASSGFSLSYNISPA